MGATESKLAFKKSIFRLSDEAHIPVDDPFWSAFWELPEAAEDISTLFSHSDIRRARDDAFWNLESLLTAVSSRLFSLRDHPAFPDADAAPARHALNCVRILTRLLPFLYEVPQLEQWERNFFWSASRKTGGSGELRAAPGAQPRRENDEQRYLRDNSGDEDEQGRPLGEELLDTLVDMLFYAGFTVPKPANAKSKITYAIWQSGIGCHTSLPTSKEFENNRCELLRLLITIASRSMYMPANILPVKGLKALTYLATCPDKQVVLSLLCSLVNATMKYNPASWRVPYDHVVFKDSREVLVNYCLQLLLVLILYPIPEEADGSAGKNYYRYYLGRLHRPQDFQFLVDGMTRVLKQPVQANMSYLPGSQKSIRWAPEMIMLFWELLQCNKNFRSFIVDTDRANDFLILVLFYALEHKEDPSQHGVVRMCVFVLQTMSVEPSFGKGLNKRFGGQSTLPASVRLDGFRGSYADYLIISIFKLLTTNQGKLQAIYPALLAVINNIAAYLENLSSSSSAKLVQLFASMSSPSFLLANETNHELLTTLLEAMNAIIEHQYSANPKFILAVIRSRKQFEALRLFTLESGEAEIDRQERQRKENVAAETNRRNPNRHRHADGARNPSGSHMRRQSLQEVPEEGNSASAADENEADDGFDYGRRSGSRTPSLSSLVDDNVPLQLRGMSEKARGKMPANMPSFSRQNSSTSLGRLPASANSAADAGFMPSAEWVDSWVPELPLHTMLTLIREVAPQLPSSSPSNHKRNSAATAAATTTSSNVENFDQQSRAYNASITSDGRPAAPPPPSTSSSTLGSRSSSSVSLDLQALRHAHIRGVEPSPIRVRLFEWSALALGWYESLLWGFIFASDIAAAKGAVGIWTGTAIKLFRVQEGAREGPSLLAPRGAVDAVGSNLVQRIGSLSFRGGASGTAAPAAAATGEGDETSGGATSAAEAGSGLMSEAGYGSGSGSGPGPGLAAAAPTEHGSDGGEQSSRKPGPTANWAVV